MCARHAVIGPRMSVRPTVMALPEENTAFLMVIASVD